MRIKIIQKLTLLQPLSTMACPTKSLCTRAQKSMSNGKFTAVQYPNSASEHISSSESSDEMDSSTSSASEGAICHLYKIPQMSAKRKHSMKAAYTGDSHASKYQKVKSWWEVSKGCAKIEGFFKSLFGKSFSKHDEMLKQPRHFIAVGLSNNPDSDHHADTQQALPAASACSSSYPTHLSLLSIHRHLHVSTCHQTCQCILDRRRDRSSS